MAYVEYTTTQEEILLRHLCLTLQANQSTILDDETLYCNTSWNSVSCWPRTPAGTVASIPCPSYLIGINHDNNATRECYPNGTWAAKTVYDLCVPNESHSSYHHEDTLDTAERVIYNVGYTISTLALGIALFIFLFFRSLRCLRNSIHCHLIVSFIAKNLMWIIMRHSLVHLQFKWVCKLMTSLFNFLHATNFFWMFVEGMYLHVIIVWTFSADKIRLSYLLCIGWGIPAVNMIAWIIVRKLLADDDCWLPDQTKTEKYDYVYMAPILFVLCLNIIFMATIVWVLITKLRASHTLETRQYRKAVKATIILFPLLGITYVFFIMPPVNHPTVETVFKLINAILQSFQGLLVAFFYCFLNGEVKGVLKKKISRLNDARSLSTKFTRTSYGGWTRNSEYGHTAVTMANGAMEGGSALYPGTAKAVFTESIPLTDTNGASSNIEC
ncbi:corticotropin-releasing factor receptor 1-like isoform X2 [Dreissena polymorpha]|uniref:corticotropin-releasing factor receptor 1-like isoform X2 n=1 Tax=Dreissena polymorpha TaxID=45954 RepID=UPI0022642955|nr:corticotropin-releasing factor receptor 1-like isoform X2 [Dreissena polymorpha]XP_052251421.1 corticotropin-releasing factor receptor 1-like isoform X2 [Dreissena polymorpha]XP_052251422.1 corticotropin-releasing factor receptor 1-like isoform X2 [Dreissena polymorpha]XP_052251423.1 corticotropin-releasing factor receptor 1-like isoform X2 [Dreissena polymorpha]